MGTYECLDTAIELQSCGGCASKGQGEDCSAWPHQILNPEYGRLTRDARNSCDQGRTRCDLRVWQVPRVLVRAGLHPRRLVPSLERRHRSLQAPPEPEARPLPRRPVNRTRECFRLLGPFLVLLFRVSILYFPPISTLTRIPFILALACSHRPAAIPRGTDPQTLWKYSPIPLHPFRKRWS